VFDWGSDGKEEKDVFKTGSSYEDIEIDAGLVDS
jgi:hypothetical protein